MASGKIRKFHKTFLASAVLCALFCPVFANDIEQKNPAKNESAISQIMAPSEIPMTEFINSFFAPVGDNQTVSQPIQNINILEPQPLADTLSEKEKTMTESETNSEPKIVADSNPAKSIYPNINPVVGAEDFLPQAQLNPFKILDTIKLPSEYKSGKTQKNNLPDNAEVPETHAYSDAEYDASIIEDVAADEIDYEGKKISGIKYKGLVHIQESDIDHLVRIKEGSPFNIQRIQNDLQNIYAIGYFKDNICVEPMLKEDDTIELTFVLEENLIVDEANIKGNTVFPPEELHAYLHNMEGLPQNLNLINEAIENINNYYQENGYVLAKVSNIEDNADGKLSFVISEGIIRKINFEGNEKTKDYVIERNILTKPGSVYNEEIFKKDLSKVYSTQIFEKVDRTIKPCPDNEEEYIITVKVKEASSNKVSIGIGIDNALGGFGTVGYHENNLFGRNQKLSLTGMLGSGLLLSDSSIKNRMNWNVELNFFEPYFFTENNTFNSKFYYRDLGSYQVPLAIERRVGWNNVIEHKVRNYDNLSTSLAAGIEYINLSEGDINKIAALYRQNNLNFALRKKQLEAGTFINFAPGVKYSTLDNELMPREGWIAKANFVESLGLSNINRTNGRVLGSITKYIPIAQKSALLVGAKGGIKVHGDHMPEVMTFRLGGPYTIRGFRMNGVGSGESFVMASTELQTPIPFMDRIKYDIFKNLRFAFFVDAGKVFNPTITSTLYDRPLSAITIGAGLRINIPGMSTITIDYGLPLTNTGHFSSQHGYFTFGTGGLYDSY